MKLFLIAFLIIAAIIAAVAYKNRDKIKIHPMFRSFILRQKMIVNIYNTGIWKQNDANCTIRPDVAWTKQKQDDLIRDGYYKFVDYLSGWKYIGTKCYVKFWNMKKFDVDKWNSEHPNEEDKLNDMKSFNLYDYFRSKVVERFMKGFSKVSLLNGADSSKLALIAIVSGGIILGLWFLLSSKGVI